MNIISMSLKKKRGEFGMLKVTVSDEIPEKECNFFLLSKKQFAIRKEKDEFFVGKFYYKYKHEHFYHYLFIEDNKHKKKTLKTKVVNLTIIDQSNRMLFIPPKEIIFQLNNFNSYLTIELEDEINKKIGDDKKKILLFLQHLNKYNISIDNENKNLATIQKEYSKSLIISCPSSISEGTIIVKEPFSMEIIEEKTYCMETYIETTLNFEFNIGDYIDNGQIWEINHYIGGWKNYTTILVRTPYEEQKITLIENNEDLFQYI